MEWAGDQCTPTLLYIHGSSWRLLAACCPSSRPAGWNRKDVQRFFVRSAGIKAAGSQKRNQWVSERSQLSSVLFSNALNCILLENCESSCFKFEVRRRHKGSTLENLVFKLVCVHFPIHTYIQCVSPCLWPSEKVKNTSKVEPLDWTRLFVILCLP